MTELFSNISLTPEFIKAFIVMMICIIIDFATGFTCATINGEVESKRMKDGAFKKIYYIVAVLFVYSVGWLLESENAFGIGICGFFIAVEGISVLENLGKMGIPVPNFIINILAKLKDKYDSEDYIGSHEA